MASVPPELRALVARRGEDGVDVGLRTLPAGALPPGDVTVRVAYSSVNYKDALVTSPQGRFRWDGDLVPGIDLAGEVVASDASGVAPGDSVVVHGYDLGVSHHGGYAELARVPAAWVVPLPEGLTTRQAMALGTAGFTAGLSVAALEERGLAPDGGPVLVLGATGGVGSTAVGILAERGYEVVASTGKAGAEEFLRGLGASEVLSREETSGESRRPLESERWAAVVDPLGGAPTAYALRTARYGGAVALSGLVAGTSLETTVMPFILRGVALLGIDSVGTPIARRREIWGRLASDLRPRGLDESITREISLDELPTTLERTARGEAQGRTVVRIA